MTVKHMVKYALVICGVLLAAQAQANFPHRAKGNL